MSHSAANTKSLPTQPKPRRKRRWKRWVRNLLMRSIPKKWRLALIRSQLSINYNSPAQLSLKIAETEEELLAAYNLLYQSYVAMGYMKPDDTKLRVTFYHLLPSTTTLIAKWNDEVVGTVSIFRDNADGLPLEDSFSIEHLRKEGHVIGEISSLAVAPSFRSKQGMILLPLLKFLWLYTTEYFGLDYMVIATHPKMVDFYEGLLHFDRLSEKTVSNYDFANGRPAVGGALNLNRAPDLFIASYGSKKLKRNLYYYFTNRSNELHQMQFPRKEDARISDPVIHPQLLNTIFSKKPDLFNNLNQKQMRILLGNYGNEQYRFAVEAINKLYTSIPTHDLRLGQPRTDLKCAAELSLPFSEQIERVDVRDCSAGGLKIFSKKDVELNKVYQVKVALSEFNIVAMTVKPVWGNSHGYYGLKIVRAPQEWEEFVKKSHLSRFCLGPNKSA